jgi:iron complex outermembrane receptor protein
MTPRAILCATVCFGALGGSVAPSWGQSVPAAQATAPASTPPTSTQSAIAEVVVTAQKRTERLQDVPISIEVVSGQKLQNFHATDMDSVMDYIPNLYVEQTPGDDVIYMRGFGSPPANFSFDQSVSLYIDGIYAGRSAQTQGPFFDLERVEVLRGPQGALFGKNTPAGAISVVSAGPTDTFQAGVTGAYNFNFNGYDISGYVSGPITSDLSARLAVRFLDEDGWIKNDFNGNEEPKELQQLARLTVKYAPAGPFDYTVKVDYGDTTSRGGINVSSPLDTPQQPSLTRYVDDTTPLGPEGTKDTSWIVSGTGDLKLGDFTLTSVSGYSFFKSDIVNDYNQSLPGGGITNNSVYNAYPERFEQVSQEIRLASPTGRKLEYIVGAYYDESRYSLTELQGFNIPAFDYQGLEETFFNQREQSVSAFGQATYHILSSLRIIGSLRYTNTDKRADYNGILVSGPYPLQGLTSANGSLSEGDVDPSVTLQYDVAHQVMLYATYGRGSKSGGFVSNTFGTTDATFEFRPEKSENFEVGVKSTLLDGKMTFDAALYDTRFHDLQVSVYDPTTSNYLTGNAASASSKGIEAAVSWFPVRNFDITGSAAYEDVTYDNYPGASCLDTETLAQCNPADPASIAANNIKGSPLPYTSKFTGNVQVHYRLNLPHELKVDATGIVSGRSKFFDSDTQDPLYGVQPGYAKFDLRIQLAPDNDRWHIAFVGKNLTNVLTTSFAFDLPAPITSSPRALLYLQQARNIEIEAGYKF